MKKIHAHREFMDEREDGIGLIFFDTLYFTQINSGKYRLENDCSGYQILNDDPWDEFNCNNSIGIENEEYTEEELVAKLQSYYFEIYKYDIEF